jgi:two-component system, OmpR family, response regulator VanR
LTLDNKFKKKLAKLKLVYIEDDDEIREYIKEFFERYLTQIYCAKDAETGIELYKKYRPHLLIVDINLPKQNGLQFIKNIRKRDKETKVVISTAYTNREFMLEAIELQITRYLVKPLTSDDLFKVLEKVMEELKYKENDLCLIDLGEGFIFNTQSNILFHHNAEINLRKKELELLNFFISKNNTVITYEMIDNEIWYESVMTPDAIRSQIRNIRRKTYPKIFQNISGIGYKLNIN